MTLPFERECPRFVASASRAEQFSVWALRLWWRAFPELQAGWGELLHGFRICGVPAAVESCHRFCSIVLAAAGQGSGIACVDFPRIVPTEAHLLEVLAAGSSGDLGHVERLLRSVVQPAAARIAAGHAVQFAQALANAGLEWGHPTSRVAASMPSHGARSEHEQLFAERLH